MRMKDAASLCSNGVSVSVDVNLVSTFDEASNASYWVGSAVGDDDLLAALTAQGAGVVLRLEGGRSSPAQVRWSRGTPAMLIGLGPPPFD
jgi:hypothetical protein